MFKFLKEKLKGAISKISRKIGEEKPAEEPIKEKPVETEKTIYKETQKTKEINEETEQIKEGISEEKAAEEEMEEDSMLEEELRELEHVKNESKLEEQIPQAEIKEEIKGQASEKKKGFFSRLTEKITTTKISQEKFENLFSELELILMENNVAMGVIDKIKNDLSKNLVEKPIKRTRVEEIIKESLRKSIEDLFNVDKINLIKNIKNKGEKPFVIAFFGINGSGKTTSIAKVANMLRQNKLSVVLAASDTFRAASIEQLQQHADRLGVKMIRHDYGSDPAAVAFDAIKHAKAKDADVVLIDTAGRLHSQQNLMEEMKKIMRVAKPDLKVFVGESITGNDCVEQAKSFNDAVGIDGIILAKADVDEKGGAAISVSYVTKRPIMYLGVGQGYKDLKEFEPRIVVEGLGL